jgi:osmotically-inducible protein OsmY
MERENLMKSYLLILALLAMTQSSCAFFGGAATGAVATGAAYEIQAKRQMDRLEDDFKNRRISREEYEDRKQQIQKGSIIY